MESPFYVPPVPFDPQPFTPGETVPGRNEPPSLAIPDMPSHIVTLEEKKTVPQPKQPQDIPSTLTGKDTFKFQGFTFNTLQVNQKGEVSESYLTALLMYALCFSKDEGIRKFLRAADVKMLDITGKQFFPLPTDF